MFRPFIPATGVAGWNFLQANYDRQLKSFAASSEVRNDQAYMAEKLSRPIKLDNFLDDRRLLRIAMTAFGLGGEEWKRGFIKKVLTESANPQSTFLARLNNTQYTRFAEVFKPTAGVVSVTADSLANLRGLFEAAAFEDAVGNVDNDLRLSLNYASEIGTLVRAGSAEQTSLFRLLGNVPVRTVLERATNLPTSIRALPLERQADLLKSALREQFGVRDIAALASPTTIRKVTERFNALQAASATSAVASGSSIVTLFGATGGASAENLFRSRLS